jgi:hypothetical protein
MHAVDPLSQQALRAPERVDALRSSRSPASASAAAASATESASAKSTTARSAPAWSGLPWNIVAAISERALCVRTVVARLWETAHLG